MPKTTETWRHQEPKLHGKGKNKVSWHTTFGDISVLEPIFRGPGQPPFRPFLTAAKMTSRCCSMPLQRVMTDFGADHASGLVPNKWREHYGIEMPDRTIREVTEFHAKPTAPSTGRSYRIFQLKGLCGTESGNGWRHVADGQDH